MAEEEQRVKRGRTDRTSDGNIAEWQNKAESSQ